MTRADRILLRLDAQDCWAWGGGASAAQARAVEPVVVHGGGDSFGTVGGMPTIAELQDQMALWAYRMAQLTQAYANYSPTWVGRDANGFVAWTNDWTGLQARYNAAASQAQSAVTASQFNPMPASTIPVAKSVYDALPHAMRASYPPDGGAVRKGDWKDLFDRLRAAGGSVVDSPPQPTAADADIQVFAPTAPIDVTAQLTGGQAPGTGPLPKGFVDWLHGVSIPGWPKPKTLLWIALAVGGGVVFVSMLPVLMLPAKLAKGAAALAA